MNKIVWVPFAEMPEERCLGAGLDARLCAANASENRVVMSERIENENREQTF